MSHYRMFYYCGLDIPGTCGCSRPISREDRPSRSGGLWCSRGVLSNPFVCRSLLGGVRWAGRTSP